MSANRKLKLKIREEKQSRHDARRRAILDRLSNAMGLKSVFERLPAPIIDVFLKEIGPPIEVVTDEESGNHCEIQGVIREITPLIRQPLRGEVNGRRFVLAYDDIFRGYISITHVIDFFCEHLRRETGQRAKQFLTTLEEAKQILQGPDSRWFWTVAGTVISQITDVTERNFRIDGPIIEARMSRLIKTEGGMRLHLILRRHEPRPRVVIDQGTRRLSFPCRSCDFMDGVKAVSWNCQKLGIDGPNSDLSVLISKHAIERLHERLPLRRHERLLHRGMVKSLDNPVLIPSGPNRYLVEFRLHRDRLGYLVAEIRPAFILIKTFLFLTMKGTPESKLLKEKLGLYRADVEHYKLDDFSTIVGSDIVQDPLLHRVLSECGCGHLLTASDPELQSPWLESFGEKFKKTFNISEAPRGFFAGEKWNGWSN